VSNIILIVCVSVLACFVAAVLVKVLSLRLVQWRQERLKAHLDWVNPMPQTSRKRGLARR